METRAPKERVEKLRRSLKFQLAFCVEPRGLAGGALSFLAKGGTHPNF